MGRTKSGKHESNAGSSSSVRGSSLSPVANENSNGPTGVVQAEVRIKELLKELFRMVREVQDERSRSEHNLTNIARTHERMQQESRVTPYYKTKLKGLYSAAMQDADNESELLRKALDKIKEIKTIRENRRHETDRPKQIMRRGVLMTLLQQNAVTLPLWVSKPGERPPPLCGAVPADSNYAGKAGDKVAARVKGQDGEENWILAEVVTFSSQNNKYDVDDIDAEEGKERHSISRRRVVPLPIWKANPETDPDALFPKGTLVLALYPQTTCFYRALVEEPPKGPQDDYSVLFEDTSYLDGYSPPLMVAQRYVIACKDDKKK